MIRDVRIAVSEQSEKNRRCCLSPFIFIICSFLCKRKIAVWVTAIATLVLPHLVGTVNIKVR